MAAQHGSVDMPDDDTGIFEEEHEFETFAQEFIEQNNLHEVAANRKDFEELPPVNIMNITGIVSDDVINWNNSVDPSKEITIQINAASITTNFMG